MDRKRLEEIRERLARIKEAVGQPFAVNKVFADAYIDDVSDLLAALAEGGGETLPKGDYKTKRALADGERWHWRKFFNDYSFNNCDHEHGPIPRSLACIECVFECFAHLQKSAPPASTDSAAVKAACIEKVKKMRDGWRRANGDGGWASGVSAANEIITALESLSAAPGGSQEE